MGRKDSLISVIIILLLARVVGYLLLRIEHLDQGNFPVLDTVLQSEYDDRVPDR